MVHPARDLGLERFLIVGCDLGIGQGLTLFHQRPTLDHPIEAGAEADVTGAAIALGQDLQQHRILVAIDANLDHRLDLAAGFALAPQRLARAAEIMRLAGSSKRASAPRPSAHGS
jgi:hypothetical protein